MKCCRLPVVTHQEECKDKKNENDTFHYDTFHYDNDNNNRKTIKLQI